MCNAKDEFLGQIKDKDVLCSSIVLEYEFECQKTFILKIGYTLDEFNLFLQNLNFTYDNSYGSQNLYGTIWYKDGTWSERAEYDGSEWWVHKVCPPIPDIVL